MKRTIAIVLALFACGCGLLSNDFFFDGVGQVSGRLLVNGQPASGALAFVLDEEGVLEGQTADANGDFRVVARAGRNRYLVVLWGSGFGLQRGFDLAGEAEQDLGRLEIQPLGELTGKVSLRGRDPQQAQIRVVGTDWYTRPERDGSFRLSLPAGRWSLQIDAPGFETERLDDLETSPGAATSSGDNAPVEDRDYRCEESEARIDRFFQGGSGMVDVLFVVDNSRSMVGEQLALARSFENFVRLLGAAGVDFRIAVVTTGMESEGCLPCPANPAFYSCINETGECGRFQNRLGHNIGTIIDPIYEFETRNDCKLITSDNLDCFYDSALDQGVILVGVRGCGFERGLEAVRAALNAPLIDGWNSGFLRPSARLAVVVVSDEEDCGEVGDVTEFISGISGKVCYYSAKGVGPDGSLTDPDGRAYRLTLVSEYVDFLDGLKASPALVTFSAIVGIEDPKNPSATQITYESDEPNAEINAVCETPGCVDACPEPSDPTSSCVRYCKADPGTRYIELAALTGGAVETICQDDFSGPLLRVAAASTGYRRVFPLSADPLSANGIEVRVEGEVVMDWNYDADQMAVVFVEDMEPPPPWAAVEIEYQVTCWGSDTGT